METFSALLALCAGNSPVTGEFPVQRPVTRSFDVFFDLRLNKPLSKQSWGWWFEMTSRSLWRHCNVLFVANVTVGYKPYQALFISHVLLIFCRKKYSGIVNTFWEDFYLIFNAFINTKYGIWGYFTKPETLGQQYDSPRVTKTTPMNMSNVKF